MSADIRISVGFPDHPKTVKLDRRLGFQGIRSLLALWTWAAQNRPDGDLGGANGRSTVVRRPLDEEDIEIAARWPGEPGLFVATLVALGWLDRTERGYLLHEWQQHNPWVAAATDRSDKARFSRVAKTHPDIYKSLCEQGIRAISAEEFARLKAGWPLRDRSTGVEGPFDDRSTTVRRPFNERATPSPSPAPSPIERKEKEREARETARPLAPAGTPAAPTRWVASPVTEIDKIVDAVEIGEAREDGDDETRATNGAPASTAIAIAIASTAIAPEASGTAELAAELAAGQTAEPESVAESAAADPVADAEPAEPVAAPAPRPDPAGDATRQPADGANDVAAGAVTTAGASDRPADRAAERNAGRRRRSPEPAAMPELPPWLPVELWARWLAHRREIRKPITADGALMLLAQLEKAKGFGHDPAELVGAAIAGGWQGCVFADRHYRPAPAPSATGPARESARRPLRDLPADPAVYREAAGFETELAVEEEA